ncbi:GLPGLI family protein [Chryseobacterium indologenes]|uniref:GLPGLI family protein n=1 Tax=Chryseobacterium indologenes TaxID=253 RepID=UPI00076E3D40|nr:GLPGLI family protein [Chryseobacterium indologenes]
MINKYIFLFLVLFVYTGLFSQQKDYSFGYRLEYTPDSADVLNTKVEDFVLFIDKAKSYFVSENFLKRDSILKAISNSQDITFNMSKVPNTRFRSVVVKENAKVDFYDNILKYYFSYQEKPEFNWKLVNEKQKIGNYNCSKAETEYGGRKWVAWYTSDLPINDGPYKFNGLPGLIVKIEDSKSNYRYDLINVKQRSLPDNVIFTEKYFKQHKAISKDDYKKAVKNINENMINEAAQNGLTIAPESLELVKKNLSKRNNPIELK